MSVPAPTSALPFVSVALATYNRAHWLREALKFLTTLDYPSDRYELIVVDNNCTDNTREVLAEFDQARVKPRYFLETKQGSSHARNRILAEARGEIVAFTDDDVMGRPDWLRRIIAPLLQPGNEKVAGVGGETFPHFPEGEPAWLKGQFRAFGYRKDPGPLTGSQIPSTANVALRRRVLDEVGHFRTDLGRLPNRLTAGEDNDLMRRILAAGYSFWFDPQADVLHVVPASRLTFSYACRLQGDAAYSRVIERAARPGFYAWVLSRIFLYTLHLPFCALVGALALLVGRLGFTKRMLTRSARAWGYLRGGFGVLYKKALGLPIDVYS